MPGFSRSFEALRDQELTLEALVGTAARLLRQMQVRPDDGRVAEELDARGVRYYQALGVIDKPLRHDGRRAVYGYRHLLQLLSVKVLQQEGHPLHLIQQGLAGKSTESLEKALAAVADQGGSRIRLTPDATRDGNATADRKWPPRLVAAQVAPGITVTVDPTVVEDPEAAISAVEKALGKGTARVKASCHQQEN